MADESQQAFAELGHAVAELAEMVVRLNGQVKQIGFRLNVIENDLKLHNRRASFRAETALNAGGPGG